MPPASAGWRRLPQSLRSDIRGVVSDECITIDARRERCVHRTEVIGDTWNDLRFALRTFGRSPGFTAAPPASSRRRS